MKHVHIRFVALTLALSALIPTLATSQGRPTRVPRAAGSPQQDGARGPMGAQAGPGDRMRGPAGRHPAAMLLRGRQQLALTDDQVQRLEAMQRAARPQTSASDVMRIRADLLDATQGDGNLAGARTALDKLSRLRNEQMISRIKLQQDARAVLTPVQRTKVDNLRQQLRGRAVTNRARGFREQGMPKWVGKQRGVRGQPRMPGGPGMGGRRRINPPMTPPPVN